MSQTRNSIEQRYFRNPKFSALRLRVHVSRTANLQNRMHLNESKYR